jgi:hypothetical protein
VKRLEKPPPHVPTAMLHAFEPLLRPSWGPLMQSCFSRRRPSTAISDTRYLLLNRFQDAEAAAKEPTRCVGVNPALILYDVAFCRHDAAEMARQVSRATGAPGVEDLLLAMDADTAAYFGHLGKARELSRRAADSARLAAEKETAAGYYAVSALREALFGDATEARQRATVAKRSSTGRDLDYGVALALAYAGDATSNPQQALDILRIAAPYELGLPAVGIYN